MEMREGEELGGQRVHGPCSLRGRASRGAECHATGKDSGRQKAEERHPSPRTTKDDRSGVFLGLFQPPNAAILCHTDLCAQGGGEVAEVQESLAVPQPLQARGRGVCERAGQDVRGQPLRNTQERVLRGARGPPCVPHVSGIATPHGQQHSRSLHPCNRRSSFFPFPTSDSENPASIGDHVQEQKRREVTGHRGLRCSGAPPGCAKS